MARVGSSLRACVTVAPTLSGAASPNARSRSMPPSCAHVVRSAAMTRSTEAGSVSMVAGSRSVSRPRRSTRTRSAPLAGSTAGRHSTRRPRRGGVAAGAEQPAWALERVGRDRSCLQHAPRGQPGRGCDARRRRAPLIGASAVRSHPESRLTGPTPDIRPRTRAVWSWLRAKRLDATCSTTTASPAVGSGSPRRLSVPWPFARSVPIVVGRANPASAPPMDRVCVGGLVGCVFGPLP